jgi:hypothetical protein
MLINAILYTYLTPSNFNQEIWGFYDSEN